MANNVAAAAAPDVVQQNQIMRELLRKTSPKSLKYVSTVTGSLGSTSRVKLFNVGILTRLVCRLTVSYTIATASAVVGAKGIYAAMNRVRLTDFDGTDRINCPGHLLWMRNSLRANKAHLAGLANTCSSSSEISQADQSGVGQAPWNNPTTGTAIGAQTAVVTFDVPICRDSDNWQLDGAILAQTTVGELYLSIDWASALWASANDDYMFNGQASTAISGVSFSLDVYQEYILPQAVQGVIPIPALDIMTVYDLQGAIRTTSDFAAGSEKLMNFPNVRQVHGVYASYLNNNYLGGAAASQDMASIRMLANGNNVLREYRSMDVLYAEQRRILGADMPRGCYFSDFKDTPIQTNLYGNLQMGYTPSATVASPSLDWMVESVYIRGAALSGISQSA